MNSMPWDDIGGVEKRYKEISNTLGCELVADNDSIYPHKMGDAAAQAFGISLSGMKKAPETSIPTSIAVQMGKIFLAAPAETEAPEPEMSM